MDSWGVRLTWFGCNNSVYFILPFLAIVSHVIKQVTGFGTHVGILSFKRLTPNKYILLCNRVCTLLSASNSMTFHDFFHHLFTFSMKKCSKHSLFQGIFDLKQFNRHKLWCPPKCVSFALFNYSSLFYIDLALSPAVTNAANKR